MVAGGTPIERAEALALIEACRVAEPLRSGLEPRISAVERRTPKALEALLAEAREADILLMLATNADAVVALAGIGNFFRAAHALVEPALILASISRGDEPGLAADMVEAAVNAYSGKAIAELEIQLPPAEDDYGPSFPLGQALQRAAPHARRVQILRELDARKRSSDWVKKRTPSRIGRRLHGGDGTFKASAQTSLEVTAYSTALRAIRKFLCKRVLRCGGTHESRVRFCRMWDFSRHTDEQARPVMAAREKVRSLEAEAKRLRDMAVREPPRAGSLKQQAGRGRGASGGREAIHAAVTTRRWSMP